MYFCVSTLSRSVRWDALEAGGDALKEVVLMPIRFEWNEANPNILVTKSEGKISWDDYHQMIDELHKIAETTTERFDVVNFPEGPMPSGNPMTHFSRLKRLVDSTPQLGLYVTVNPQQTGALVKAVTTVMRATGFQMTKSSFASSMEAAIALILADRGENADKPATGE